MKHGYILDNAWVKERERLRLREMLHDPKSIRHFEHPFSRSSRVREPGGPPPRHRA
jgi:hypothetical protein